MPDHRGLPRPPAPGSSALPEGTFDGVAVVVTGGGTGLGKAIAVEFARLGADLAVLSRKPEHLKAAQDALGGFGKRVEAIQCDIRDADEIASAFDRIEATLGSVGVLVNNAAANFPSPTEGPCPPTLGGPSWT